MDKLTILITTYNRYPYLLRLLNSYKLSGIPIQAIILDSSSEKDYVSSLQAYRNDPYLSWFEFDPATHPLKKIFEGLKHVQTKYVVICADDDFLVPASLMRG